MKESTIDLPRTAAKEAAGRKDADLAGRPERVKWLVIWAGVLVVCFHRPLYALATFAWQSDLYSYIVLIPLVSAYLFWMSKGQRAEVRAHVPLTPALSPSDGERGKSRPSSVRAESFMSSGIARKPLRALALAPLISGIAMVGTYWWATRHGWRGRQEDYLALMAASFWCFLAAGCVVFLNAGTLRRAAFPLAFLLFIVPLPAGLRDWVEAFLQHHSADVAQVLFALSGMPCLRQDTHFVLPGFSLEVAPECSGIHSTLVLFITSLAAGFLLLRTVWRRTLLTLLVVPLALLRNGFRVFVLGQLCVNIGPEMIESYIHRKGGPIFFALSLVPFFLILLFFRKSEAKRFRSPVQSAERE
jgi:exosortase C (VPDSG-CTERM-specific)